MTPQEREAAEAALATATGWWAQRRARKRIELDDIRRVNLGVNAAEGGEDAQWRRPARITDRGMAGPGGGRQTTIGWPVEARAHTGMVAGINPWTVGAGAPIVGTPVGTHTSTGAPVCYDAISWMVRGGFITAPVTSIIAANGYGKSTLLRKLALGAMAQGRTVIVPGDTKPDFRALCEAIGGQVVEVGFGRGRINPLDPGPLGRILPLLDDAPEAALEVAAQVRGNQLALLAMLLEIVRGEPLADYEKNLLGSVIDILGEDPRFSVASPPLLGDLLDGLVAAPDRLFADAGLDTPATGRADDPQRVRFSDMIIRLRQGLRALMRGEFGQIFNEQSSTRIDVDAPMVCVDISQVPTAIDGLSEAVMKACWLDCAAAVTAAHVLSDTFPDRYPRRTFQMIFDEMWRALRTGGGEMASRLDELSRLNRGIGVDMLMCTHSVLDLPGQAFGLFERSRVKIFGPISAAEVRRAREGVLLSDTEAAMLTGWNTSQTLTGEAVRPGEKAPPPPGMGHFLLKVGEGQGPGISFRTHLTPIERDSGVHDTNRRFADVNKERASA